jgi:hypothetical protein
VPDHRCGGAQPLAVTGLLRQAGEQVPQVRAGVPQLPGLGGEPRQGLHDRQGDQLSVAQSRAGFEVLTRALLRRGEFTSRADLIEKITGFAIRCNRTARPWTWAYDARADHARYRARHSGQHPATTEPATTHTLPQAA